MFILLPLNELPVLSPLIFSENKMLSCRIFLEERGEGKGGIVAACLWAD